MGVVVLKERNEGCSHGSHLVGGYVHIVHFLFAHKREIGLKTALDAFIQKFAVVTHINVGKSHVLGLFLLCAHILPAFGAEVHLSARYLAVRGLDETKAVDAGVHAQGTDKADVRTFRGLDRAQAAVVGVVHVTDLEAGAVTGKTSRAECGKTPLVSDLRKRVGLVHKL